MTRRTDSGATLALALIAVVTTLGVSATPVQAFPEHRRLLRGRYPQPVGCGACHDGAGGSDTNSFGVAWHRAGGTVAALDAIAALDADGDGIPNGVELAGGANPGDPASTPAQPGRRWLTERRTVPIPASQLELVLGRTERLEAAELELTPAQIAFAEAGLGRALGAPARSPTLYLGVTDGARTGVAVFSYAQRRDGGYALLVGLDPAGTITKVAMFRAGAHSPGQFRPYLDCLVGRARAALPAIGPGQCPALPGLEAAQRVVGAALGESLWVVAAALRSEGPAVVGFSAAGGAPSAAPVAEPPTPGPDLALAHLETTTHVTLSSSPAGTALALGSLVGFLGAVAGSARLGRRRGRALAPSAWLPRLAPHYQLLCALVTLSLVLALAGGAASAYVRVTALGGTAAEYFHQMSVPRLLGLSHVHVFGYTLAYGTLAGIACASSLPDGWKSSLVAALLWAGPFDVLSWWGLRQVSPRFELLTTVAGVTSGLATVIAVVAIARDLVRALAARPGRRIEDADDA